MANTVYQSPKIKVRVKDAGSLQTSTPITLKNTIGQGRTLTELTDVTLNNPANSDIITYVANTGNWVNRPATSITTGNVFHIAVSNTSDFDYVLTLPDTVVMAGRLLVGTGIDISNSITTIAAANITGNLTVGGITTLSGIVTGNTSIGGYANVTGTANISGNTTIGGYVSVGSYANIAGNTTIGGIANITGNTTIGGYANVAGSLNVVGNTTLANVTITGDVTFNDNIIVLNNEFTGTPTEDAGFIVNRGALANASLLWVEASDVWSTNGAPIVVGNTVANSTQVSANNISTANLVVGTIDRDPTITVTLTGDVTGTASGSLINLANGSISVATAVSNNSVTLGQHTQGSYLANVQPGTGVYITNAGGEGSNPTIAIGQDVNTNSQVTFGNTTIAGLANASSLRVVNDSILSGQLTVNGAVNVVNTVNAGNTIITGLINVTSTATIGGETTIANTLSVGNTTVNGYINATSINVNTVVVSNNVNVASLGVSGNAEVTGTLSVTNTAALGNTTVTGFINVSSTANVGGVISARANVVVNGALIVANVASLGNTTITGFANVVGNVAVSDTISGKDLSLSGNLTVSGTTTYINTTNLNVGDNIVTLNADLGAVAPSENAGIEVNRGTSANVSLLWNETTDKWTTGNVAVDTVSSGNTDITGYINVSSTANVGGDATFRSNVTANGVLTVANAAFVGNTTVTGFINVSSTANVAGNLYVSTITTSGTNANLVLDPNGTGVVVIANASGGAVGIEMGTPTLGALVSNAVSMTTNTSITDGVAQLNKILGKLVPPSPPAFPNGAITLLGTTSYRMANFTQTDNTPSSRNVAGGTTVATIRTTTFTTSNVVNSGPGDSGTVSAYFNNVASGSITLSSSLTANATNGMLRFYNNLDYNSVNTSIAAGFWSVFSANGSGTGVTSGWNEFKIGHSAAGNTSTVAWYCDTSAPGVPTFSGSSFGVSTTSLTYSSTIPHYNNTSQFTLQFAVNRLSGDTYPTTDTFATGTAGGAFSAPVSLTYATAGITTPLARNLYVVSGNTALLSTTANVVSGFGSSSGSCSITVNNSYNSGVATFSPGNTVLYKTGLINNVSTIEEANVYFGSTVGTGTGAASRIINPGSADTPGYTASATLFNSQSSILQAYDATVVGGVLKHDQTNYTGYLPAGPNLSTGRTGSQYFTFKFVRTSLQKFDIRYTGTLAGMWVAMPGSTVDTTSTLSGWLDCSIAYNNTGTPGANTAAGGNGTNGCGLSNLAVLNSAQTNKNVTVTFGPVSTSSTATNEIYVRIKLTSGQSVTALSLQTNSA